MIDKKNIKNWELYNSDTGKVMRCYGILINGDKVSDAELDEIIKYYSSIEEFEICNRLKKLKTSA